MVDQSGSDLRRFLPIRPCRLKPGPRALQSHLCGRYRPNSGPRFPAPPLRRRSWARRGSCRSSLIHLARACVWTSCVDLTEPGRISAVRALFSPRGVVAHSLTTPLRRFIPPNAVDKPTHIQFYLKSVYFKKWGRKYARSNLLPPIFFSSVKDGRMPVINSIMRYRKLLLRSHSVPLRPLEMEEKCILCGIGGISG